MGETLGSDVTFDSEPCIFTSTFGVASMDRMSSGVAFRGLSVGFKYHSRYILAGSGEYIRLSYNCSNIIVESFNDIIVTSQFDDLDLNAIWRLPVECENSQYIVITLSVSMWSSWRSVFISDICLTGWKQTTNEPTKLPTETPSISPSSNPTTKLPTAIPTATPSNVPTVSPTILPSVSPSKVTSEPSVSPTKLNNLETLKPTHFPTVIPSETPSNSPSYDPITQLPTEMPTVTPSNTPTLSPTKIPTILPSNAPRNADETLDPSVIPTDIPSNPPTLISVPPSNSRIVTPTNIPTVSPFHSPTLVPTDSPTTNNLDANANVNSSIKQSTITILSILSGSFFLVICILGLALYFVLKVKNELILKEGLDIMQSKTLDSSVNSNINNTPNSIIQLNNIDQISEQKNNDEGSPNNIHLVPEYDTITPKETKPVDFDNEYHRKNMHFDNEYGNEPQNDTITDPTMTTPTQT